MFFVISKIGGFLATPSNIIGLLLILGIALVVLRWRRMAIASFAAGSALIVLCGWLPTGDLALRVLEDRFPPPPHDEPVAGIVLLGGATNTHLSAARDTDALNNNAERITAVVALANRHPKARIILSGGGAHLSGERFKLTEAEVTRRLLVAMGIAAERLVIEDRSRNTHENAVETAALISPGPGENWLLVTSAWHMPRAMGCFRAVGLNLTPYPVDYRTEGSASGSWPERRVSAGLEMTDLAAREWVGLIAYRLAGFTPALWPAP